MEGLKKLVLAVLYLGSVSSFVIQQFSYHCFSADFCIFPLHYCSSDRHLLRCMPCTETVCHQEAPPLGCSYNCSMRKMKSDGGKVDLQSDAISLKKALQDQPSSGNASSTGWIVAVAVQSVIIALALLGLIGWIYKSKLKNRPASKTKTGENAEYPLLMVRGELEGTITPNPTQAIDRGTRNCKMITNHAKVSELG